MGRALLALAAAVALRHLELLDAWDVLANVRARSHELRALLDDRIAPKPQVRDVRLRGLMGGVELAPPVDGLRWGRRVCAAAVVGVMSTGMNASAVPVRRAFSEARRYSASAA